MAVAEAALEAEKLSPEILRSENSTRVVWTLAWPVVALNSLQVVNTLLDRGFVGQLPAAALTGYGASLVVSFLMFSLGMAVSTGATAIVSRAFGAGRPDEYRRGAQESFSVAISSGFLICILTVLTASFAAAQVLPEGAVEAQRQMGLFLEAFALGLPAFFIIVTIAGCLRGVGDTKSPMYISGIQIFLHMTLNFLLVLPSRHIGPVLIPGAGLGLRGAGCAMAGSSWISAIIYVCYVPRTILGRLNPWRFPALDWAHRILRVAMPAATMGVLRVLSLTAFTMVLKQVAGAEAAIGAMSIAIALESVMFMPSFGLSAAAAALVGQSLGMKCPDRAERLGWKAGHHAAIVTMVLAVPIFFAAGPITSLMTPGKPEIAADAALLLQLLCVTEFMNAYSMVLIGAMQGAGDTQRPLWITIGTLWGLRVPLSVVLALPVGFRLAGAVPLPIGFGLGALGAWIAMSATQGLFGVLSISAFKAGRWKTETV